ncbi:MAG: S8 family serine peptidase [Luteolibacter sp.]
MAKIPVIVVLPKQEPLLESASLALQGKAMLDVRNVQFIPKGVRLFDAVPAISAGPKQGAQMTLESMNPNDSEVFAVRGEVEEGEIDNLQGPQEGGAEVFADPQIEPFPIGPGDPSMGNANDVALSLKIAQLHDAGLNGENVAVAIMDTGFNLSFLRQSFQNVIFDAFNSWLNPDAPGLQPGNQVYGPGQQLSHGSMCAWNVLKMAPRASLLDYPILAGSPPAGAIIARSIMSAFRAYSHLSMQWAVGFAPGQAGAKYRGLVINNSWGMYNQKWDFPVGHQGRYSDNPNHIFNRLVASLAANGADIVFAAGNCGDSCPDGRCGSTVGTICGANAMQDVLTLAGCDTADQWVGYSSQGPSIAKMYLDKPDLTAYTHFQGSEVSGLGSPDSGTSTACPVAAGCIAALRTGLPATTEPPASMIAQLRATARKPTAMAGAGRDDNFGYGIIDPVSAAKGFGLI